MITRLKSPSPEWRETTPANWVNSPQNSNASRVSNNPGLKRKKNILEYPYVALAEPVAKRCSRPTIYQMISNYRKNTERFMA